MSAARRFLASGGKDGTVRVWALSGGSAPEVQLSTIYSFDLHVGDVFAACWSPDGRMVASGGLDGKVQVWSVETGEPVRFYEGHSDAVYALSWSPDSTCIASGGAIRRCRCGTLRPAKRS